MENELKEGQKYIYVIEAPFVSAGLKKTFKKKIEVHRALVDENYKTLKITLFYKTKPTSDWKQKKSNLKIHNYGVINKDVIISNVIQIPKNSKMFFYDFNVAYMSKVMLIKKMKERYLNEIKEITNIMNNNVPDIDNLIEEFQEQYPEYFV